MSEWRDIPGFPGYQISKTKSVRNISCKNSSSLLNKDEGILRQFFSTTAESIVTMYDKNKKQTSRFVDKLYKQVWENNEA